jgi:hypothetical protein
MSVSAAAGTASTGNAAALATRWRRDNCSTILSLTMLLPLSGLRLFKRAGRFTFLLSLAH